MKLLYTSRTEKPQIDSELNGRRVSLEELLSTSDVISIHTDLNPGTKHLIQRDTLSIMKRNAILVNTARGGVVDQEALYEALREERIFAAGLDVTDPEPLPLGHAFWRHPRIQLTPHIASMTQPLSAAAVVIDNLRRFAAGEPMVGLVDRTRGY